MTRATQSPGGKNAVVHIDTESRTDDQVQGEADTHQVAGLVLGQVAGRDVNHPPEGVLGLAAAQAADCEPGNGSFRQLSGAEFSLLYVESALNDGEQVLSIGPAKKMEMKQGLDWSKVCGLVFEILKCWVAKIHKLNRKFAKICVSLSLQLNG